MSFQITIELLRYVYELRRINKFAVDDLHSNPFESIPIVAYLIIIVL